MRGSWGLMCVLLAGCGRLGFDETTSSSTCDAAIALVANEATEVTLCRGTTRVSVDVAAGSRLAAALALAPADLVAAELELRGPDDVALAGPVWSSTAITAASIATATGSLAVIITADRELSATLTLHVAPPLGRVFSISPTGNNANDGSAAAPWQTWPYTLTNLVPGDTLIVDDGTWTSRPTCAGFAGPCLANTALVAADCSAGVGTSGTANAPITFVAQHQRRAHLVATGPNDTFRVAVCSSWIIDGLHLTNGNGGTNATGEPLYIYNAQDVTVRNVLADSPNGCGNNQAIEVYGSATSRVVIEDSEVYNFPRVGMIVGAGQNVVLRRNYAHSRDAAAPVCGTTSDTYAGRGDSGFNCYGSQSPTCSFENVLAEDVGAGAIDIDAVDWRVRGSLFHDTYFGAISTSSMTPPPVGTTRLVDNVVCLDCDVGAWARGTSMTVDNVTAVEGRARSDVAYGIGFDADGAGGSNGTTRWRSLLAIDNEARGFDLSSQLSTQIDHGNSFGSAIPYIVNGTTSEAIGDMTGIIRESQEVEPSLVGNHDGDCLVYVPAASNMHGAGVAGADIGANVIYRIVDGVVTDEKLWNQRTGQFPCGAIVAGINDIPGASCFDAHTRFRVGVAGCAIP